VSGAPGTGTAVTSGTESYLYDDLDRLIDVTYTDGGHVAYTYDANGNRLTQLDGTALTTYTYDNADQLATVSGASTHSCNYDANGNRTAVDADTFAYDWQDRLVEATVGGVTVSYG
jgi:YD repeat-containing protein